LINAFFLWEFNSCETLIKDGQVFPIDYANACPDVSLTSLHYYFPWAIKSLVKWSLYCTVTDRPMQIDMTMKRYFEIGDRDDLTYEEKLAGYARLTDEHFQSARYYEFVEKHLPEMDQVVYDYISSDEFDRLLIETVRSTFPTHEHERFIAHYRGLMGLWLKDQAAAS
jgi:hypothetical protein